MGASSVTDEPQSVPLLPPAFYVSGGSVAGDIVALLHVPYTAWHLSYLVIGAAVAPTRHWPELAGALLAFIFGTAIAAHAFDEWNGRPLRTGFSSGALLAIGTMGVAASALIAVLGVILLSPWTAAWAVVGVTLMLGYTLGWHRWLHTNLMFAVAWGGFPVLVGYWSQTQEVTLAPVVIAVAATLLSLAQRALSTPARHVRRRAPTAALILGGVDNEVNWSTAQVLATWETPLKLLSGAVVMLALGLLLAHR